MMDDLIKRSNLNSQACWEYFMRRLEICYHRSRKDKGCKSPEPKGKAMNLFPLTAFGRNQSCQHFDLGLVDSGKFLVFKLSSLWYLLQHS